MRLPFLRPKSDAGGNDGAGAGAEEPTSLQALRTQARRRLLGSVVLLVGAVGLFSLIFETQPRPAPGKQTTDAIVLKGPAASNPAPAVESAPPPVVAQTPAPVVAAPASAAAEPVAVVAAPALAAESTVAARSTAEAAARAERAEASPKAKPAAAQPAASQPALAAEKPVDVKKPEAKAVAKPEQKAEPKPAAKPETAKPEPAQPTLPAAGAPATAPSGAPRWVVQVGAYNDMERMKQARQKVEKMGYKTYISDVDTATGKRTRVRLGPFATKKEADDAAAKVKAQGMAANVLSL